MIWLFLRKYQKYDLRYDSKDKILFIYKAMPVEKFIELKNIIRDYELEVRDIRVMERGRK